MPLSITTKEVARVVLSRFKGEPNPPTMLVRSVPSRIILEAQPLGIAGDIGRVSYLLCQAGLVGLENVELDGAPAKFDPAPVRTVYGVEIEGGAPAAIVDQLPADLVAEVGAAVMLANKVTKDDVKNSSSPPRRS